MQADLSKAGCDGLRAPNRRCCQASCTKGCALIYDRAERPTRGNAVSNQQPNDPEDPIPLMQKLLDNPFLLLFLGVLIPMVVYTLWGVIDILTIPLAP